MIFMKNQPVKRHLTQTPFHPIYNLNSKTKPFSFQYQYLSGLLFGSRVIKVLEYKRCAPQNCLMIPMNMEVKCNFLIRHTYFPMVSFLTHMFLKINVRVHIIISQILSYSRPQFFQKGQNQYTGIEECISSNKFKFDAKQLSWFIFCCCGKTF